MVPKKSQFSPKVQNFAFVELFRGRSQIPNPVLEGLPISSESCSTVIHCSPTVPQPQIFLFELFVYQIKLPLVPQPHFCCPFSSMESAQCLLLQLVSPSVPQLQSKYFQYLCVFHVSSIQLFSDLPFKNKRDPRDNYRSSVRDQWQAHSVQGKRDLHCNLTIYIGRNFG